MLELFIPRRVLIPDFRPVLPPFIPRWPVISRSTNRSSPRSRSRARKLTPGKEQSIRALSGTKSLRALAAEFEVSHETVRSVLRDRQHGDAVR